MTAPACGRTLLKKSLLAVAIAVGFTFCLVQSLVTFVAWWQGELAVPDILDWFWIGLMPVCFAAYVRYFSIFRSGCRACTPPRHPPVP